MYTLLVLHNARSETELGTLKSFAELRYNFKNGADAETVDLNQATIELGGFRIGAADSQFTTWTGYLGDIINDDVVAEGSYVTNQISYTFTGGNGFSAFIGAEQGNGDYLIDDYNFSPTSLAVRNSSKLGARFRACRRLLNFVNGRMGW